MYDERLLREALQRARAATHPASGLGRWAACLPGTGTLSDPLHSGGTPLLPAGELARRHGASAIHLKDESRNPTRSLKDRATALFIAMLPDDGRDLACASAGNAAISLAAYARAVGRRCHVFVSDHTSPARLAWLRRLGAKVHLAGDSYDEAFARCEEAAADNAWHNRNCAYAPVLVEGKRTVAFEIAAELGWEAPDIVVAPVGDGCTLSAIGKGFRQLRDCGLTRHLPTLIGIQAAAMAPLVTRYRAAILGDPDPGVARPHGTRRVAASINVASPRNAVRLLEELRISHGRMLAIDDAEIAAASELLTRLTGVVTELTSAATAAALEAMASSGDLRGQRIVLVLTGGRVDGETG